MLLAVVTKTNQGCAQLSLTGCVWPATAPLALRAARPAGLQTCGLMPTAADAQLLPLETSPADSNTVNTRHQPKVADKL